MLILHFTLCWQGWCLFFNVATISCIRTILEDRRVSNVKVLWENAGQHITLLITADCCWYLLRYWLLLYFQQLGENNRASTAKSEKTTVELLVKIRMKWVFHSFISTLKRKCLWRQFLNFPLQIFSLQVLFKIFKNTHMFDFPRMIFVIILPSLLNKPGGMAETFL